MGASHLYGFNKIGRREGKRQFKFFSLFPAVFLPSWKFSLLLWQALEMRTFSLFQWWHGDKRLRGPKVLGRLKVSLVHADTRWLPAPSHACSSLHNGKLSGAVGISSNSWVDRMIRSNFLFWNVSEILSSKKADLRNSYDGYAREFSISRRYKGRRQWGRDTLWLWE